MNMIFPIARESKRVTGKAVQKFELSENSVHD